MAQDNYYYNYLLKYLTDEEDPRKDDEDFIHDRSDYAESVYQANLKSGHDGCYAHEIAMKVLMDGME